MGFKMSFPTLESYKHEINFILVIILFMLLSTYTCLIYLAWMRPLDLQGNLHKHKMSVHNGINNHVNNVIQNLLHTYVSF